MKVCEICGNEIFTRDGDNRCDRVKCQDAPEVEVEPEHKPFTVGATLKTKRKRRTNSNDAIMRSLGLVKVRGALGGVYWE